MSLRQFLPKYFKGLATCGKIFTFGLAQESNRSFIHNLCRQFGWRVDEFPPELPLVSPNCFLVDEGAVALRAIPQVHGNVSVFELLVLASVCASRRPATIFEIGTFDGRTTLNLAANAPPDAQIFTLDLPASEMTNTSFELLAGETAFVEKPSSGHRFVRGPYGRQITQLYGDSARFDFAPYRGAIDLIFIDASHAYEYVLSDSRSAIDMLRAGGTILWHDYGDGNYWQGVNRALNELRRNDSRFQKLQWIEDTSLAILSPDPEGL